MGLDRIGTFRCKLLEHGVDKRKKKGTDIELPWFNARVLLTEVYDVKEGKWFDYTGIEGVGEAEITAFLCLYGAIKKKGGEIGPTLSMDQVKKVFNWDGRSLIQLANGKYDDLEFQVRIGENTYEEATYPYQVNWIDMYDAEPGTQLRKLDAAELKSLDKQFAAMGAKNATAKPVATAAKAPAKTHPARVPADDTAPDSPEVKAQKMAAKSAKNKAAVAKVKAKTDAVTAPPAGPPPKPESKDAVVPPAKPDETACTMNEAWNTIVELRDPSINDKVIGKVWHGAIAEIAGPDVVSEDVTPEQWVMIRDKTLESVAKF
ncbi:hypothetical protein LCGC14_0437170 [marine sediment metagenome]|uniref:Uncharacterized protein n=1 Tax=marine sediment metagenome TaxID=412755 RepID=A0A0F9V8D7_9ZZZZ